jgi:hypothetical protein
MTLTMLSWKIQPSTNEPIKRWKSLVRKIHPFHLLSRLDNVKLENSAINK